MTPSLSPLNLTHPAPPEMRNPPGSGGIILRSGPGPETGIRNLLSILQNPQGEREVRARMLRVHLPAHFPTPFPFSFQLSGPANAHVNEPSQTEKERGPGRNSLIEIFVGMKGKRKRGQHCAIRFRENPLFWTEADVMSFHSFFEETKRSSHF